jgi:RNA polymerase sigma-70 factor (ECF subfamily)
MTAATTLPAALWLPADGAGDSERADARVRAVVDAHYDALWRFVRRMGVAAGQVEDAVQQVLVVFARRSASIGPGAERSFLFATACRVASEARRKARRAPDAADPESLRRHRDPAPDAEARVGDMELRRLLDALLDEMPGELRAVFVLAELEETTMAEISRLLSIPPGTVASRLRRAREYVDARAADMRRRVDGSHLR